MRSISKEPLYCDRLLHSGVGLGSYSFRLVGGTRSLGLHVTLLSGGYWVYFPRIEDGRAGDCQQRSENKEELHGFFRKAQIGFDLSKTSELTKKRSEKRSS